MLYRAARNPVWQRLAPVALCVVLFCGCGEKRITPPARTAAEQLLISAAADRAIDDLSIPPLTGKKVFFDPASLEALDKLYVTAQWRAALARKGSILQAKKEDADLVIEPRSGALSVDQTSFMIGLPKLTVPIPLAGMVETPELAVFKMITLRGIAKFAAHVSNAKDGSCAFETGHHFGRSRERYIWVLMLGPFTWSDTTKHPNEPYMPDG